MRVWNASDALCDGIANRIHAHIGQPAHGIVGGVRTALILGNYGDPIRIVAVGPQPGGIVEGQSQVIAQFGTGNAVRKILVVQRRPASREIYLREGGRGKEQSGREKS